MLCVGLIDLFRPFRAGIPLGGVIPGRCPGLDYCRPFRAGVLPPFRGADLPPFQGAEGGRHGFSPSAHVAEQRAAALAFFPIKRMIMALSMTYALDDESCNSLA